jgi:alcohol dehydrogenase class IV
MAHSLGAVTATPHGLANAMLLPHVMRYNCDEVEELTADIAGAMGVPTVGMDCRQAAEAAIQAIEALIEKIGLPRRLRDIGIEKNVLEKCAELALADGSIVYNPKIVMETEEVLSVYMKAY